ncbi:MAG TPA: hypothetical protein VN894_16825 [Polyangiaceae bacterium]|nr:hypothetical protein [Polyangiaceae bacterium]
MSADGPQRKDSDAFDVVLMHGPTDDGEGARVLRARPGRIDTGEVRPMREGRPFVAGTEVVRLERRADAPAVFDVHVECSIPAAAGSQRTTLAQGGPPQVSTPEYRENWELTFGARRAALN